VVLQVCLVRSQERRIPLPPLGISLYETVHTIFQDLKIYLKEKYFTTYIYIYINDIYLCLWIVNTLDVVGKCICKG